MEVKKILGYVPFALLLLLLYLSYLVVLPFLGTIVGALLLALIFHPLYARLERKTRLRNFSAFVILALIIVLFSIPAWFVLNSVAQEANSAYLHSKSYLDKGLFSSEDCDHESKGIICQLTKETSDMISGSTVEFYLKESVKRIALLVTESAGRFIVSIPALIVDFFLMLFIVFFALREGKLFFVKLDSILPLSEGDRDRIFGNVRDVTYGVIYGSIIVAIIQGILGGLGFFLFGFSSPILWGLIMGVLAFIPLIGPMLIWFPASVLLILNGLTIGSGSVMLQGFGLLIYGFLCISSIESIIKPMIIGNHVKTHPVIIIVGVLGGIKAFGILGLVVGPLILELLITFVNIVKEHWWAKRR